MHRAQLLHDAVARWLAVERQRTARRPFVVAISGPQGGGKSTLAAALVHTARSSRQRAVTVSSDDFYLRRTAQVGLAERYPESLYLQQRGYPGTHDVALGTRVLDDLRAGRDLELPRYDKSAYGGRGDRAPRSQFEAVHGRQDLVVFEGWTLGFSPRPPEGLAPAMQPVNRLLAPYAAWTERVDAWVVLRAPSLDDIVAWRVEAERNRAKQGAATLSEAEARRYIERCLPAYQVYLPPLWREPPSVRALRITLGPDRQPRSFGG